MGSEQDNSGELRSPSYPKHLDLIIQELAQALYLQCRWLTGDTPSPTPTHPRRSMQLQKLQARQLWGQFSWEGCFWEPWAGWLLTECWTHYRASGQSIRTLMTQLWERMWFSCTATGGLLIGLPKSQPWGPQSMGGMGWDGGFPGSAHGTRAWLTPVEDRSDFKTVLSDRETPGRLSLVVLPRGWIITPSLCVTTASRKRTEDSSSYQSFAKARVGPFKIGGGGGGLHRKDSDLERECWGWVRRSDTGQEGWLDWNWCPAHVPDPWGNAMAALQAHWGEARPGQASVLMHWSLQALNWGVLKGSFQSRVAPCCENVCVCVCVCVCVRVHPHLKKKKRNQKHETKLKNQKISHNT